VGEIGVLAPTGRSVAVIVAVAVTTVGVGEVEWLAAEDAAPNPEISTPTINATATGIAKTPNFAGVLKPASPARGAVLTSLPVTETLCPDNTATIAG
jgi:hypothetical protein